MKILSEFGTAEGFGKDKTSKRNSGHLFRKERFGKIVNYCRAVGDSFYSEALGKVKFIWPMVHCSLLQAEVTLIRAVAKIIKNDNLRWHGDLFEEL